MRNCRRIAATANPATARNATSSTMKSNRARAAKVRPKNQATPSTSSRYRSRRDRKRGAEVAGVARLTHGSPRTFCDRIRSAPRRLRERGAAPDAPRGTFDRFVSDLRDTQVPMDGDVTVSNRAWLELLHAEVCWALAAGGVDVLVIKGPSISSWLYPDGDRESADVDLLLRPSQWDAAASTLERLGFEPTYTGFREDEIVPALARPATHQRTAGAARPRSAPLLPRDRRGSRGRVRRPLGWPLLQANRLGVAVWFPSIEARALIIALHAARQPRLPKTLGGPAPRDDARSARAQLQGLAELARRLDARPALRAGLETLPETTEYVEAAGARRRRGAGHWVLAQPGRRPAERSSSSGRGRCHPVSASVGSATGSSPARRACEPGTLRSATVACG